MNPQQNKTAAARHVLGLSGGKDSSALAIYMRDKVPTMEYFFCDTGAELPETYEYLDLLEGVLGRPIARLNSNRDFDHWLLVFGGALPSAQMRWCTKNLKIKPFEDWVGDAEVYSYIGIRADEDRIGYVSHKPNIKPVFPFQEDGIRKTDVLKILESAGLGLPTYYQWRTRSGCYFCFFQRKYEWVSLAERHPELFERAVEYEEKVNFKDKASTARDYTWSRKESLRQLIERKDEIRANHEAAMARGEDLSPNQTLQDIFSDVLEDEDDEKPCMMCHL